MSRVDRRIVIKGAAAAAAVTAVTLLAGLVAAPTGHAAEVPRRIVENLDRGLVATPSGGGTFLSWRLLGTEYARHGNAIAFNVYKNGQPAQPGAGAEIDDLPGRHPGHGDLYRPRRRRRA